MSLSRRHVWPVVFLVFTSSLVFIQLYQNIAHYRRLELLGDAGVSVEATVTRGVHATGRYRSLTDPYHYYDVEISFVGDGATYVSTVSTRTTSMHAGDRVHAIYLSNSPDVVALATDVASNSGARLVLYSLFPLIVLMLVLRAVARRLRYRQRSQ